MGEASDETASFLPEPPTLVADHREPDDIITLLERMGVVVERRQLAPADYVVGSLAIERKSVADFHASMIDRRLFEQMARLREAYPDRVALLLEGDTLFFMERQQPRSVWGALSAIAIDMGIAILPTPDALGTAELLSVLAVRAGRGPGGGRADVRYKPRALSPDAAARFAVQGLPRIGDVVSDNLLAYFGSVRRVFAADERAMQRVAGIGKGRAHDVSAFLDRPYEGRRRRLPDAD